MGHRFFSVPSSWSRFACEAAYILDEAPDFFVRQLPVKSNHAGTDRSVFDHPENFAFCAMAPESRLLEITGQWIQLGCQRPIAVPVCPMTVEAGTLAAIKRFTLLDDFRRIRQRTRECACGHQLVCRHQRLHHIPLGGPDGDGKGNQYDEQREYSCLHHPVPVAGWCGESN